MTEDAVPVACTLDAAAVPDRLAQWGSLAARAASRQSGDGGSLRLQFADTAVLDDLARLVRLEQACCAFFTFVITVDAEGVQLEVRAPAGAAGLVGELFGPAPAG